MNEDKIQRIQYESTRRAGQSVTRMTIPWGSNRITFEVEGKISMALRRAICLTIYRGISTIIRTGSAPILHEDAHFMSQFNEVARHRQLTQTVGFTTSNEKLGATIRFQRLQANWTLNDLAQRASVSPAHLSRIEHGQFKPQERTLQRIHKALKVRPLEKARAREC